MELTNKDGKLYILLEKGEFLSITEPYILAGERHLAYNKMMKDQFEANIAERKRQIEIDLEQQKRELTQSKKSWILKLLEFRDKQEAKERMNVK